MIETVSILSKLATMPAVPSADVLHAVDLSWAGFILWMPLISLVLCGLCAAFKVKTKAPAVITIICLATSFVLTLFLWNSYTQPETIHLFDWLQIHWEEGSFVANFALYVDSLTLLWMLFVTGLGTLIAVYASEYMEHDVGKGYTRFFAGVSVFLFAMTCLVMGDNLLVLYLGWEGVGFASYWLIGYFYQKPSAVAAAKKAFIVNRIGDVGLALAIYLIWTTFGTVQYDEITTVLQSHSYDTTFGGWTVHAIPYLLMLAAFGKSAQLPLYVWLPDAMEGPTPVSALIHAATMVTAGIYLIIRTYPLFMLDEYALPTVAWVGGLTAFFAATIGMAQYDIKRIMAYSTVSQLGYMFLGLGVVTSYGAAYHVFTHAFFKAVLFLTCGAIMHGFAGQLDLRRLSGLRKMKGWKIVSYTMLVGCLCLAGFPFTSGYFSKDAILAEAFVTQGPGFQFLGWLAIFTAGLTAYYTFRVWFRVCAGPVYFEPGDELHGEDPANFHPHAPRFAINFVLVAIALGALLAALPYFMPNETEHLHGGWIAEMVNDSPASAGVPGNNSVAHAPLVEAHGTIEHNIPHGDILGMDPHKAMYYISGVVGFIGIGIALFLHLFFRSSADTLRSKLLANRATRWLPTAMENKWYVDEVYIALIRSPLWILGKFFSLFDKYIIDGALVNGVASLPRASARWFAPLHNGSLQSYAISMVGGAVLVVLLMLFMPEIVSLLKSMNSQAQNIEQVVRTVGGAQ
ncbi:MAG: NADH-quinone oxidoreductase subunit L [Phycisphaerae bacterium]|nr:NADH-quinone oxidoreductase subunit L [Phycisphaerae bacterium]|tara:strand:+ start:2037 stop:4256 length:2220 start_codon:yes stop_codon:yes gene_type:complete